MWTLRDSPGCVSVKYAKPESVSTALSASVASRIQALKDVTSKGCSLRKRYLTWQRGRCRGIIDWFHVSTRSFKEGGGRVGERLVDALRLALKMEEDAASQGLQAASRSQKRHQNGVSPGASRKDCRPAGIWILAPKSHLRLPSSRTEIIGVALSH